MLREAATKDSIAGSATKDAGVLQRKCGCGTHTIAGGECGACKAEPNARLQRSATSASEVSGVPSVVHDVLRTPGQPLDLTTRAFFEPRFNYDFSQVRVHTDSKAAESAEALNALAYTVGREVVFGAGRYAPGGMQGRHLLAHELTHVMQQGSQPLALSKKLDIGSENTPFEHEADQAADALERGEQIPNVNSGTPMLIQRAVRFSHKAPLTLDKWDALTTSIVGDRAVIGHGDFAASANVHAEADAAGEFDNWEVGFLQNDRVTWSRTYWTRANADNRGKFLERKLKVPATPLRDHLNDAIVWSAPGEFQNVATAAGAALSVDIPLSSSDAPDSRRPINGSDATGADASDGTDNIFQYRQGDNFISFISAHNSVTDEWRHLELVYWSVQDSVDFAPNPAGGVTITRDDRALGKSKRFRWSAAADQPAIGATRANTYVNDPANTTVKRVNGWT